MFKEKVPHQYQIHLSEWKYGSERFQQLINDVMQFCNHAYDENYWGYEVDDTCHGYTFYFKNGEDSEFFKTIWCR